METLALNEIISATGGTILQHGDRVVFDGVSTDTRTACTDDLFIALKGDTYDAHNFITDAYRKKCSAVVVSNKKIEFQQNITVILVKDTLKALGDIAGYYRKKIGIKVIAVTGSNGKTSTKDMLVNLLSSSFSVASTKGTKNNLIGVPLTIFSANRSHDMLVAELGINQFGEMELLGKMTQPDTVIITNIAPAHLELLCNVEGVFEAKSTLFNYMNRSGIAVINKNDFFFNKLRDKVYGKCISFGIECDADYTAYNMVLANTGVKFDLTMSNQREESVELPLPGSHNVSNFLAALAVAEQHGVQWGKIKEQISKLSLPDMRMETIVIGDVTIINDSYNANPVSTKTAIDILMSRQCCGKKILVFGDMCELGEKSEFYHRQIGQKIAVSNLDILITVGKKAGYALNEVRSNKKISILKVNHSKQVIGLLREIIQQGDIILIKGSRANKLEIVADELVAQLKSHESVSEV